MIEDLLSLATDIGLVMLLVGVVLWSVLAGLAATAYGRPLGTAMLLGAVLGPFGLLIVLVSARSRAAGSRSPLGEPSQRSVVEPAPRPHGATVAQPAAADLFGDDPFGDAFFGDSAPPASVRQPLFADPGPAWVVEPARSSTSADEHRDGRSRPAGRPLSLVVLAAATVPLGLALAWATRTSLFGLSPEQDFLGSVSASSIAPLVVLLVLSALTVVGCAYVLVRWGTRWATAIVALVSAPWAVTAGVLLLILDRASGVTSSGAAAAASLVARMGTDLDVAAAADVQRRLESTQVDVVPGLSTYLMLAVGLGGLLWSAAATVTVHRR